MALIGWPWSGLALGAAPVAEELKVPMVCTWATNPKVTEGRKYVSRVAFIDTFGGKIIATFLVKDKGVKKIAILQDTKQPYSTGLAEFAKKEIEALGGTAKIYSTETGASPPDVAKVIDEIVKSKPEAVVMTVYSREAAMSLALLKEKGFKGIRMMGDTGGSPSLWEMSGGAVDGMYFYDHFHPDGAKTGIAEKFVEQFRSKYNKEPYAAAAVAYDAYLIVYNAIKNCLKDGKELTRDNINYYIRHTKDLEGVTGKITIDPEAGNPTKPAFLIQWKGNKPVFLKLITP
ncbi:MAG: ABC transporter substrate-binding protein [Synergistetes bacterium]|nr:ABC transporter substrate-binding protein [Synergistota bacterium]